MDLIGNIEVPSIDPQGVFPITVDYGFTTSIDPPVVIHPFFTGNLKREQRYQLGPGARKWKISREIDNTELDLLTDFWESHGAASIAFTFNAPTTAAGDFESVTAKFTTRPIVFDMGQGEISRIEIQLEEVYTGAGAVYTSTSTVRRFPSDLMNTSLAGQVQKMIKLVRIKPKTKDYPTIFISDQRVTIDGQLYLPRLLRWGGIQQTAVGLPGVDTSTDDVTIVCGNADRVMRMLADDVQLDQAVVEILCYHVNTDTLLELWAGIIVPRGWQSNAGPEFTIKCSDKLSSPFLILPTRVVDRKCDALYDSEPECPFSRVGSLNPDYPDADASFCDHGYATGNGCQAHSMKLYYRGIISAPQSVRVKDNSSGLWGFFRQTVTATSLINDSAYGAPIPIVITDVDIPVAALILAGREEGDFYQALGVVCEGPIILAGSGHTLDSQFHHGYGTSSPTAGLELNNGSDPASIGTALELIGDPPDKYTAGIAFLKIRRSDPKGIQLTQLAEHNMEAIITYGLLGYTWNNGYGARGEQQILTNPVWLAVNMYLLALKLFATGTDAGVQEDQIDIDYTRASAAICDLAVNRIVELDEGLETQWKFIGVIRERKALRDWLSDILVNCLGYYTFSFGRLRIGVRENASALSAYTSGNIIWKSLQLTPLGPEFTKMIASFADREFGFVTNTADFQDDDYASELGDGTRPVHHPAETNLSGTADISQATRWVVTRGREEVGGINADERKAARRADFKTTALGLDTEAGMVISITDPEIPGGFGHFRVEKWSLNDDWSIDLRTRTVTASMYDLVQGPKPADVRPDGGDGADPFPFPTGSPGTGVMMAHPNQVRNLTQPDGDNWRTFKIGLNGVPVFNAGGALNASTPGSTPGSSDSTSSSQLKEVTVEVLSKAPINQFVGTVAPEIISATASASGGNLHGGRDYYLCLCQRRADGKFSNHSNFIKVTTPDGSDNCSISIDAIRPATGINYASWVIFASVDRADTICAQDEFTGIPSSYLLTGPLKASTYNLPSNKNYQLRAKVKPLYDSGIFGVPITSVDPDGILISPPPDPGADYSFLFGRTLRVIPGVSAPKKAADTGEYVYEILDFDAALGKFITSPAPEAWISDADVVVVDFKADIIGPVQIGDSSLINWVFPTSSLAAGADVGFQLLHFPDRDIPVAQAYTVVSNDTTSWTVDSTINPPPTDKSYFVVCDPAWALQSDAPVLRTADGSKEITIQVKASSLSQRAVLVGLFMVDPDGVENDELISPVRTLVVNGGGAVTASKQFTFGVPDDTVGDDVLGWHGNVHGNLAPFRISINAFLSPSTGRAVFDILYTRDKRVTWVSIFPDGNDSKLIYGQDFVGLKWKYGFLPDRAFRDGDELKLDVLEGGGGTGYEIVLECGAVESPS